MLGQQILGMRAKKWGESMRPPSRRCIDPLKTIIIKKTLKKNIEKIFYGINIYYGKDSEYLQRFL